MRVVRFGKDHALPCHNIQISFSHLTCNLLRRRVDVCPVINRDVPVAIELQDQADVFLLDLFQPVALQELLFDGKVLSRAVLGHLGRQYIDNPTGGFQQFFHRFTHFINLRHFRSGFSSANLKQSGFPVNTKQAPRPKGKRRKAVLSVNGFPRHSRREIPAGKGPAQELPTFLLRAIMSRKT